MRWSHAPSLAPEPYAAAVLEPTAARPACARLPAAVYSLVKSGGVRNYLVFTWNA